MRRGHPGIGGWRNENSRQYRPRNAGNAQFGAPRPPFPLLDIPRYPPPGPRPHRNHSPYNSQHKHSDNNGSDHRNRDYRNRSNNFRHNRSHYHDTRQLQFPERHRHDELDSSTSYKDNFNFYEKRTDHEMCHVNSMGDVDHRLPVNIPSKHQTWQNPQQSIKRYFYNTRNNSTQDSHPHSTNSEVNRIPVFENSSHRPPSSDHYGSNTTSSVEKNDGFSHSVDDTVDIIRKRLLNRNDPQHTPSEQSADNNLSQEESSPTKSSSYQNLPHEQTPKRRAPQQQVQPQMIVKKSDCEKVKNKIVQTFFNMNKHGIHKLIDNPSSSAKFEYAISSLLMETQISLNSRQRSAAEKSLMSSADFIHSDKNTAYEDTFMKQMQCILDPQDSVLLEDIKPVVMAEMTRVLKLDDGEYQLDARNPGDFLPSHENNLYANNNLVDIPLDIVDNMPTYDDPEIHNAMDIKYEYSKDIDYAESKPLYERRPIRRSCEQSEMRRVSFESRQQIRRSLDKPAEDIIDKQLPLFESNTELLSDEDDPFAELDNQYHVAVDHNFIENDDLSNIEINVNTSNNTVLETDSIPNLETPTKDSLEIKKEIDDQLQDIAKSPLKLFSPSKTEEAVGKSVTEIKSDPEPLQNHDSNKDNDLSKHSHNVSCRSHSTRKSKDLTEKPCDTNTVPKANTTPSSTRKRSLDQKPSHRKEKRKKSESISTDTPHQTMDKFITITEKCLKSIPDTAKTHKKPVTPKNDAKLESKKPDNINKNNTEKMGNKKDTEKKPKEKEKETEIKKRRNSCHVQSITKDTNNTVVNELACKADPKTKLKTIDMFVGQPKKVIVHQAHRNTAVNTTASVPTKPLEEPKPKQILSPNKIIKKPTTPCKKNTTKETQTIQNKLISRLCQTEKKKMVAKSVQTDPVCFERPKTTSNDAYERMKEIDLEIQDLLQEKFKLYSSLESGDTNQGSMQTLGMTVFNVPLEVRDFCPNDSNSESTCEDTIVEQFTSIPTAELEQIAFESVQIDNTEAEKPAVRSRRAKVLQQERQQSDSPTSNTSNTSKRSNRKTKGPNISLIEQIITDDRPLEDIISLDVLEEVEKPPPRIRKRTVKGAQFSRRRVAKKAKQKAVLDAISDLKDCSVVLLREDLSNYSRAMSIKSDSTDVEIIEDVSLDKAPIPPDEDYVNLNVPKLRSHNEVAEESVGSYLQFDMLDVSEDIVIGDSSDAKCEDRDNSERVPISEEIILDNSQSSMDDVIVVEPTQEENECRMYDYSTDENLRRDSVLVSGHADAVLAIECIDKDFIAACLDGNVYHFSGEGRLVTTMRGSNLAVTCLTIVREAHATTVYTGSLDSRIRYYDLETGLEKGPECNVLSPIQTMDRAWDTVFVGTRTGFVLQFECKNNLLIPVSTVKFSEQSILALRALKEGPRKVLLVAARSENVTIKDAQTGLLLRTLQGPKMTVYTLLFEDGKVYCGTSSHQIHVFDYASGGHVGGHSGGKGAVCLRATGGLVFAGCYDGCVYVYREGQPRPLAQLRGPSLMLLSLAVCGSKLIVGYKDRSLYIWKIPVVILQEMIL